MATYKRVKGALGPQIKALCFILILLVCIAVYVFQIQHKDVDTHQELCVMKEFTDSGDISGTMHYKGKEREGIVKVSYNPMEYNASMLKVKPGMKFNVWYSKEHGYTLYNPNTQKYDKKVYEMDVSKVGLQ